MLALSEDAHGDVPIARETVVMDGISQLVCDTPHNLTVEMPAPRARGAAFATISALTPSGDSYRMGQSRVTL